MCSVRGLPKVLVDDVPKNLEGFRYHSGDATGSEAEAYEIGASLD